MDVFTVIYLAISVICSLAFAFVIYSVVRMALDFLTDSLCMDNEYMIGKKPLLLRIPSRVYGVVLALFALSMVL